MPDVSVSRQWPAWRGLAMKLKFAMPVVGSIVGSAAGLSAFYRGLGRFLGAPSMRRLRMPSQCSPPLTRCLI